jgi:thiol-disulfide isomerase/thioredoxin
VKQQQPHPKKCWKANLLVLAASCVAASLLLACAGSEATAHPKAAPPAPTLPLLPTEFRTDLEGNPTLIESSKASARRVWLGVEMAPGEHGVVIESVYPRSPAQRAGLLAGDEVQKLGDAIVLKPADLHAALALAQVGDSLPVLLLRAGQQRLLRVDVEARPSQEELMIALYRGQPAPSISTLQTLQGDVVPSFSQLRGNVVVLEFWASWCVACRALTPELNRWNDERSILGLRVLGVTMDPWDLAAQASAEFEIGFPVFIDSDGETTRAYRATALPMVFVIDKRGTVRDVMVGFDPEKLLALQQLVTELLGES